MGRQNSKVDQKNVKRKIKKNIYTEKFRREKKMELKDSKSKIKRIEEGETGRIKMGIV